MSAPTKSKKSGAGTLAVEVTNISMHGFWILLADREVFVSFKDFPWFKKAPVEGILNVEWPHPNHLFWPDLDIDLAVESIDSPQKYPLVSSDSE